MYLSKRGGAKYSSDLIFLSIPAYTECAVRRFPPRQTKHCVLCAVTVSRVSWAKSRDDTRSTGEPIRRLIEIKLKTKRSELT